MNVVSAVKRLRRRYASWKRTRRIKGRDSRCHRCGLLGIYPGPDDQDCRIEDLGELPAENRTTLESELVDVRARGEFPAEYDMTKPSKLGWVEWLRAGVKCGISAPRGPSTSWFIQSARQDYRDYLDMALKSSGALVTVRDPDFPGPLGRVIGVASTPRDFLLRAHDCEYFVAHQPGLSPASHVGLKSNMNAKRREEIRKWATLVFAGVAAVAGVVALILRLSG